jgi:hypothetical protein
MNKTIEDLNFESDKVILDGIAEELLHFRVSAHEGVKDVTVRDLYPLLSDEQLDYLMSKYKGPMERG